MTKRPWKFVTSHALVLGAVADSPDALLAEIAAHVGITERATHGILKDLSGAGYVTITRVGRRNTYRVDERRFLRHRTLRSITIRELLDLFSQE